MILYIVANSLSKYQTGDAFRIKLLLEKLSRDTCLVIHYSELSWKQLQTLRPWAIVHSGGGATWDENPVLENHLYKRVMTRWDCAQLAICLSHQVLATHYGCRIVNLRELRPDDPDFDFTYRPGQYKENGIYPVVIDKPDALFRGFKKTLRVRLNHAEEICNLPPTLLPLAHTPECAVQVFRHRDKPLYGVQFHPESATPAYPDGTRLLKNFFRLARAYAAPIDRE